MAFLVCLSVTDYIRKLAGEWTVVEEMFRTSQDKTFPASIYHASLLLSPLQLIIFISLFRTRIHPMCPFGANEVNVSSANAMPHSMPKAVNCAMQTMEMRRTFGSLFTSVSGNCRSGLIDTMCCKVTFQV